MEIFWSCRRGLGSGWGRWCRCLVCQLREKDYQCFSATALAQRHGGTCLGHLRSAWDCKAKSRV